MGISIKRSCEPGSYSAAFSDQELSQPSVSRFRLPRYCASIVGAADRALLWRFGGEIAERAIVVAPCEGQAEVSHGVRVSRFLHHCLTPTQLTVKPDDGVDTGQQCLRSTTPRLQLL